MNWFPVPFGNEEKKGKVEAFKWEGKLFEVS